MFPILSTIKRRKISTLLRCSSINAVPSVTSVVHTSAVQRKLENRFLSLSTWDLNTLLTENVVLPPDHIDVLDVFRWDQLSGDDTLSLIKFGHSTVSNIAAISCISLSISPKRTLTL